MQQTLDRDHEIIDQYIMFLHTQEGTRLIEEYFNKFGGDR
jgi:hypothetical protein